VLARRAACRGDRPVEGGVRTRLPADRTRAHGDARCFPFRVVDSGGVSGAAVPPSYLGRRIACMRERPPRGGRRSEGCRRNSKDDGEDDEEATEI
jgi:hypothetical protein